MPAPSLVSTSVVLLVLVLASWAAWRAYARPLALGLGAVAVLPAITLTRQLSWLELSLAVVPIALLSWHRWSRTASTVTRWGARSRRKSGVASSLDIARTASARAVRRNATQVRPSTAELSRWQRWHLPTTEFGALLCRVGAQWVWSSIEGVVLVFGGPRMGKSGWLAGRIIDAPGAILVTSTRTDLLELTGELRRRKGPVFVFNAVGLGGIASTITFNPLTGCDNPVTAVERATDMIAATSHAGGHGSGDRAYWDGQARRVLAALLHAAALGGATMREVASWVSDPDDGAAELIPLLKRSPEPAYLADATQFVGTNDRTRTSTTSTIMPALGWLTHPAASAAASGGQGFDVAWLLENRATIYLLGAEETHAAPLVCALTGHVAREARRLAAHRPGGRLDPPLTLALDEAALISPVPLHSWTSDMGGRGVTIIAAFQSRAQLIDRYGEAKAATIVTNAASKVLFGGTSDRDDLGFWSTLAGERDEPITTTDLHGRVASRTVRRVPVLAPAQLAGLPTGKVVVFTKGMPPVVGRAPMAWHRADVRAVLRPDSLRVRSRALVIGAATGTGAWLRSRAAAIAASLQAARRAIATAAMTGWRWVADTWTALRERVGWTKPATPEAVVPEKVVPFSTQPRPTEQERRPAPLPAGDWLTAERRNGHEPGGQN